MNYECESCGRMWNDHLIMADGSRECSWGECRVCAHIHQSGQAGSECGFTVRGDPTLHGEQDAECGCATPAPSFHAFA